MTNIIIASYKDEAKAIEAAQRLHELETLGDITVYDSVLLRKNADGKVEVLNAKTSDGLRTAAGMAIGTVVGALAGPIGMVAGMFSGVLGGAIWEAEYFSFSEEFGMKVANKMQPDTTALIAEIDEDNVVFVDGTLNSLGGQLMRTPVDYEYEKYDDEQIEAIDEEIAAERANLKKAATDRKEKIRSKIEELKEKRKKRIAEFDKKRKEAMETGKAKLAALDDEVKAPLKELKISRIKGKIERHQARLAELETELKQIQS
jgi:uncharacterized membrane protein